MKKKKKVTFGWELVLNLYDCNLDIISSKNKIQQYVNKLCRLIKMKKYGKTWIPYFGHKKPHTKGYSLVQLIETSSITGHFSEEKRSVYINIFSCKAYDHKKARAFTRQFFQAKSVKNTLLTRP
ncbi:MAG: S-adenosylmethionine decarboxylase [Candidatus Omnitrophica bacterium]|nr:S-adenosylmethionine decarboxylase [Candidatus Omnitrophota bacterium]